MGLILQFTHFLDLLLFHFPWLRKKGYLEAMGWFYGRRPRRRGQKQMCGKHQYKVGLDEGIFRYHKLFRQLCYDQRVHQLL